jgi:prolyl 4-hydroxylase
MEKGLKQYRNRVKPLNTMFQYWPGPGSQETFVGREGIQILRYRPGQKYDFHHDQADFADLKEYHRTLSTVIYLNGDFEGGGTEFSHKTFKPKPGYALFFPSNWCYPHSGQEVISGEKRVAVTWWFSLREPKG